MAVTCPQCQRQDCGCGSTLLPPMPEWRYELQQRVDAYRLRHQRPVPTRVLPFRAAAPPPEPLAEPVILPPRLVPPEDAAVIPPQPRLAVPRPSEVAVPLAPLRLEVNAVRVPEPEPVAELAECLAAPPPPVRRPLAVAWPQAHDAEAATFLQLPLPMWAPAAPAAPPVLCPVAPRQERMAAAIADGAVVGAASAAFALAGWLSLGMPALDLGAWRHWLPAVVAVPGMLAALYLLVFAYFGGTTLGMRWWGLQVVGWDGQPLAGIPWRRGWASVISLAALGLGFVWAFCDSQQLTWHDYISRTCVARVEVPESEPVP